MEKIKVYSDEYETDGGNSAYQIKRLDTKEHIKTTNSAFINRFVSDNGFIWVEPAEEKKKIKKAFSTKEKTAIMVQIFRDEIKGLYKDYPNVQLSIGSAEIVSRNKYASTLASDQPKYGIAFSNGTSIYVPERVFNYLSDFPTKHLNG